MEKWIETIVGDHVRWGDVARLYYVLHHERGRYSYGSYYETENGRRGDFFDLSGCVVISEGGKESELDAGDIMLLHELAIEEIELGDRLFFKIPEMLDEIWDEFCQVRAARLELKLNETQVQG